MTKGKILKQIRAFCIDCMGGVLSEIENCTSPKCSLFDFRRGKDPFPTRKGPKEPKKHGPGGQFTS